MIYFCCQEHRREAVREHSTLNGIDFLEVLDRDAPTQLDTDNRTLRQRTLLVRCFKSVSALRKENVRIEGGTRITTVKVLWAYPASAFSNDSAHASDEQNQVTTSQERDFFLNLPEPDNVLVVRTDSNGDFSPYQLSLIQLPSNQNFDPQLSTVDFSFKVECPSDFDCQTQRVCPPEVQLEPDINYLAKDYLSFRQLMLDRLSLLLPQCKERNPADVGITLVELLAYVGDRLSYQQDAIATEAYLGTARHRVSVRRHARLVDYLMHDGCNARVWVQVQVNVDTVLKKENPVTKQRTRFLTQCVASLVVDPAKTEEILALYKPEVFEPIDSQTILYEAHNTINFYTWGAMECCLPKGSTRATLKGHYPKLNEGNVLIFVEVKGAKTGKAEDADPTHRHPVRLTQVKSGQDPLGGRFLDPPNDNPTDITEIEWAAEDALPFPVCISAITDKEHGEQYIEALSIALGNIILADHGLTLEEKPLKDGQIDQVPPPKLFRAIASNGTRCQPEDPIAIPPRFRPQLQESPLTQVATILKTETVNGKKQRVRRFYDPNAPAAETFTWKLSEVLPAITLNSTLETKTDTWHPQHDLLNSNPDATEFVAEVEEDGTAYLRFGDDNYGLRPNIGTTFAAVYRVGNGTRGNVGAEAIAHIISDDSVLTSAIITIRNPLAAQGGIDPESSENVRQNAPSAFRTQERAVTPADYAEVTQRHPQVQRAAATFRWTGSWYTVFVTVDRLGGLPVDGAFKAEIRQHLERYRMAGHDLEIDAPRFVSLEIEMAICVLPNYFRSEVKAALLEVFSNRILPDGRRGVFHPDNFSFGQAVYLSSLYATAQAVAGVASVEITIFQRQGTPSNEALDSGKLELGRLEIARLDNDPNFPEKGVFNLKMEGGK